MSQQGYGNNWSRGGGLHLTPHLYIFPLSLLATLISLPLLTVAGCATPEQRRLTHAWREVCREAPYTGGELSQQSVKAMAVIGWDVSVDEINRRCR